MPTVYTFYHPVPQLKPETALLDMWRESWDRNGWIPVVLGLEDAKKHPMYDAYRAGVSEKAKSVNPGDYDLMCWLRWLAFAQMGGGVMTDYDVINRSFKPEDAAFEDVTLYESSHKIEEHNELMVYEISKVPCCVGATQDGAKKIVDGIHSMPKNNGKHYSDMYWFNEQPFSVTPNVVEFLVSGWENAKAVHFCNNSCQNYRNAKRINISREQIVRRVMFS